MLYFAMSMKESARALSAYHEYCKMGPGRTLAKLAEKLGRSLSTLEMWSATHSWVERARAYDEDRFRQASDLTVRQEATAYQTIISDLLESSQRIAKAMEEEIENLRAANRLGGQAVATIWRTATELKLSLAKQIEERQTAGQRHLDISLILRQATDHELEVIESLIQRIEQD
jgi:hypothetical protein